MEPPEDERPPEHPPIDQDRIDEAMKESFPASDPPSWTAGRENVPPESPEAEPD